MQDNSKEFDLQVRSMLEDAEVKAPRRAWKSISRSLDASSYSYSWGWMKWAGAGLAAAAVVAAGIFFTGTGRQPDRINPSDRGSTELLAQKAEPQTQADIQPEASAEVNSSKMPAAHSGSAAGSAVKSGAASSAKSLIVSADAAETQEAPSEIQDNRPAVQNDKVSDSAPGTGNRHIGSPKAVQESDPFAEMAAEDAIKSKRGGMSLYAQGAIGGNDSDIRINSGIAHMAPGTGNNTGISELSESVYGVPFSLGVGVRFYLTSGISIGTGIDYSLLTRTFTGKYTEVSGGTVVKEVTGNVSHALQYIGVPLNIYYDLISGDKLKLYVFGGSEAEYCISNKFTLFDTPDIVYSEPVKKLQFSVGVGMGVEFKISRTLGLYVDPGLRYYFPSDQPKSVRTDKPVIANFDAGLRFNF